MTTDPLIEKTWRCTEQARALRDQHDDDVPADVARQIDRLLKDATAARKQHERDRALADTEGWLREPQYKHDMGMGMGHVPDPASSSGDGPVTPVLKSFLSWCRDGQVPPQHKADLVENATGQNLVPTDFAGTIVKAMSREGVIRGLATIYPTRSNVVDLGNVTINTAGWGKLETGTTATDALGATPGAKDTISVWDLNALAKIGRDELEDSDENLADIIRQAVAEKFGEVEDDAYAAGSGTSQPWGIGTRATGGVITQSVAAATNATVIGDDLKKLPFRVPARFRRPDRAVYLMHSTAMEAASLLKDSTNNYLIQPDAAMAEAPSLFGYRTYAVDGLPAMTPPTTMTEPSVIFGDVKAGYMIAQRAGLRVQRLEELYAAEGKVGFLFTMRVGGDVIRPMAFAKYLL